MSTADEKTETHDIANDNNEQLSPIKKFISFRFIVAFLSLLGCAVIYITRASLNVAMIVMVNRTAISDRGDSNISLDSTDSCLVNNETDYSDTNSGEFEWSPPKQGVVMGSFFYGYICLQIFGGQLAKRFGAKWVIGGSLLMSASVNLLTPVIARWNFIALIVSRVVLGLFQGLLFPAFHYLFSKWIPEKERSTFVPWLDSGRVIGIGLVFAFSGEIIRMGFRWTSIFYISGIIALIWCVFWTLIITSKPSDNRCVSESEKDYISRHTRSFPKPFPWLRILRSSRFHAFVVVRIAYSIAFEFIIGKVPAYLQDVIHFRINENGYIFASIMMAFAATLLTCGYLADLFINKTSLSRTQVRKIFETIAGVGVCASLASVPAVGCDKTAVVVLLVTCMLSYGFTSGGDVPIITDMTKEYVPTAFAIMNSICSVIRSFTSFVVGLIIDKNPNSMRLWSYTFYLSAAIVAFGTLFFVVFASAEEQNWEKISATNVATNDKSEYSTKNK